MRPLFSRAPSSGSTADRLQKKKPSVRRTKVSWSDRLRPTGSALFFAISIELWNCNIEKKHLMRYLQSLSHLQAAWYVGTGSWRQHLAVQNKRSDCISQLLQRPADHSKGFGSTVDLWNCVKPRVAAPPMFGGACLSSRAPTTHLRRLRLAIMTSAVVLLEINLAKFRTSPALLFKRP